MKLLRILLVNVIAFGFLTGCSYLFSWPAYAETKSLPPTLENIADDWLAYGDLRGYLEPCGCDPATDLGGLRRIKAVIDRERGQNAGVRLFDLGNNLPTDDKNSLKIPFLLEATAAFKPLATLFNVTEMQNLEAIRATMRQERPAPKMPYVLSNQKPASPYRDLAAETIIINDLAIVGYVSPPAASRDLQEADAAFIKSLKAKLKGKKSVVLLFSGAEADLAFLSASGLFHSIISSNANGLDVAPGVSERADEKRLLRQQTPLSVHMVPNGGQGILRGGALRFREAKPLGDLLGGTKNCTQTLFNAACEPSALQAAVLVTWLDKSKESGGIFVDLFERYAVAAKQAFSASAKEREKHLAASPYIGAEACKSCHAKAYEIWHGSAHAKAMATLKEKNKHEDGECVACHVVGAKAQGGFVSLSASPHLANVQCENCHGPRREHAQNPAIKPKLSVKAGDVCVTCHNTAHSPSFNKEKFWPRIQH